MVQRNLGTLVRLGFQTMMAKKPGQQPLRLSSVAAYQSYDSSDTGFWNEPVKKFVSSASNQTCVTSGSQPEGG